MRFETPIHFQKVTKGKYDPNTGNYAESTVTEECVYADVTETRVDTLKLVYGEIKQGCLTVRLQNIYRQPFDCIKIGDKSYRVDYSRKLRTKHIFVVSEVQ